MTAQSTESEAKGGVEAVINGGYCIGCGSCASVVDSPLQMELGPLGMFEAKLDQNKLASGTTAQASAVCPFSDASIDETEIGKGLFGEKGTQRHDALGYYLSCHAGYVSEGRYRDQGSSGGMGSWLQCELLEAGLADYVINVKPSNENQGDKLLFRYTVCATKEEVLQSSKSRYYPIELTQVLDIVRKQPGRYVFVGLPCYVKAARLLCRQDPLLADRLKWFIGLVCGHLKSKRFAEFLGWQLGVPPDSLSSFDFRKKIPGQSADHYGVEANGNVDGKPLCNSSAVRDLEGCDWGRGYLKYKACDYCDDVLAETADVVVGDAWLPQFSADWQGTNVIVIRHPEIEALLRDAQSNKRLHLDEITADEAARSQDAGLRHRRDGLRYRLYLKQKSGEWHPKKRFGASRDHLSRWDRKRHQLREAIRDSSHLAFAKALEQNDLESFTKIMTPVIKKYDHLNSPQGRGLMGKLRSLIRKLIRK